MKCLCFDCRKSILQIEVSPLPQLSALLAWFSSSATFAFLRPLLHLSNIRRFESIQNAPSSISHMECALPLWQRSWNLPNTWQWRWSWWWTVWHRQLQERPSYWSYATHIARLGTHFSEQWRMLRKASRTWRQSNRSLHFWATTDVVAANLA